MTQKPGRSPVKSGASAAPSPPKKSQQTGPTSDPGKAVSAMNAVKTGLHVTGWLDEQEQSEFESLYSALCKEYNAVTPTLLMQIERMASTMVKMRRLQKIEAALFQKARQIAKSQFDERPLRSDQSPGERDIALDIAQVAAMPDMDRLSTLQRYQTSLDRQLSKIVGEIRILSAPYRTTYEETRSLPGGETQHITRYANKSSSIVTQLGNEHLRSEPNGQNGTRD